MTRYRLAATVLAQSILALSVLTGALAGCGQTKQSGDGVASVGGSTTPAAISSEPPAADSSDRALQFTKCLRAHGIDVPDPGPDGRPRLGGNVDQGKLQAAMQDCRRYAPDVVASGRLGPEEREQMLTYLRCLREHGVTIDDPDPETGMPQRKDLARFRDPDAGMTKAQQACADKRPNFLGGH